MSSSETVNEYIPASGGALFNPKKYRQEKPEHALVRVHIEGRPVPRRNRKAEVVVLLFPFVHVLRSHVLTVANVVDLKVVLDGGVL